MCARSLFTFYSIVQQMVGRGWSGISGRKRVECVAAPPEPVHWHSRLLGATTMTRALPCDGRQPLGHPFTMVVRI